MVATPSVVVAASATADIKTKATLITVTPISGRPGQYAARLNGGRLIVKASRQPFLDAPRVLVAEVATQSLLAAPPIAPTEATGVEAFDEVNQ
jgi:hypothetical protein